MNEMGRASREKGKRGERELAAKLRECGYECRRGVQYCGRTGAADVIGLPAVFHRRNNCDWLVTMTLEQWMEIYREWEAGRCLKTSDITG